MISNVWSSTGTVWSNTGSSAHKGCLLNLVCYVCLLGLYEELPLNYKSSTIGILRLAVFQQIIRHGGLSPTNDQLASSKLPS